MLRHNGQSWFAQSCHRRRSKSPLYMYVHVVHSVVVSKILSEILIEKSSIHYITLLLRCAVLSIYTITEISLHSIPLKFFSDYKPGKHFTNWFIVPLLSVNIMQGPQLMQNTILHKVTELTVKWLAFLPRIRGRIIEFQPADCPS